jgi:hypothetical protein
MLGTVRIRDPQSYAARTAGWRVPPSAGLGPRTDRITLAGWVFVRPTLGEIPSHMAAGFPSEPDLSRDEGAAQPGRPVASGAARRSVRIRVLGRSHLLRRAEHPGGAVLLHETTDASGLPEYAVRRALVRRAAIREPGAVVVFRHVLRGEQVTCWIAHTWAGGRGQYREASGAAETAARWPAEDRSAAAGTIPRADRAFVAAAARLVPALLARMRRRGEPDPGRAVPPRGGVRGGVHLLADLQQRIEGSEEPGFVRAAWRAARGFSVVDPRCASGERLIAAHRVLEIVYRACLARMEVWLGDLARAGGGSGGRRLADFRRAVELGCDGGVGVGPPEPLRIWIFRANLFGADPEAGTLRDSLRRLGLPPPDHPRDGLPPHNLLHGDLLAGFGSLEEIRAALDDPPLPADDLRSVEVELETLRRTRALLREIRDLPDGGGTDGGASGPQLARRVASLRRRLDIWSAWAAGVPPHDEEAVKRWIGAARPLHACAEFGGLLEGDGFDVVLAPRPAHPPSTPRTVRLGSAAQGSEAATRRLRERPERGFRFAQPLPLPGPPSPTMRQNYTTFDRGMPGYPAASMGVLAAEAPGTLHLRGNVDLLEAELLAIFCSVRVGGDIILRTLDAAREIRGRGIATIGGFQSPLERECLAVLLQGAQPVVISPARRIEPMRLPATWRDALSGGRLLLVSRFDGRCRRPTTRTAELRNRLVAALASRVLIAGATPGGRLATLAAQLLEWKKPVFTWDDPRNADLVRAGVQPVGSVLQCLPRLTG